MKLKKIYWDKTDPDKLTTVFMGLTLAVYKNNDKWEARLASPQQRPEIQQGFDMANAIKEVDRSNYTKFNADGTPYIRPDGKIGKNPETYQAPELEPFLTRNKGDQNES